MNDSHPQVSPPDTPPSLADCSNPSNAPVDRPRSATSTIVAATGALTFLGSLAFVVIVQPFAHDVIPSAILVIAVTTVAIFAVDLGWEKVHRRRSTGLDYALDDPSWRRTLTKYLGLLVSVALVGAAYWLIPEYRKDRYDDYFATLRVTVVPWLVLALPYFYWVDRKMHEPRDGYWQIGSLVLLRLHDLDRHVLAQHLLSWTIKGFFMALMWSFLCNDLRWLFLYDFTKLDGFDTLYGFLFRGMYMLDVGLAALGYAMSFRVTDTQIRSAEPTVAGWVVTLACYEPFWSGIFYPFLHYDTGYDWVSWLAYRRPLLIAWGSSILILNGIYVWATVIFGPRFSNLTHRGILTNGPYRFTKHPAYIAKNLTWWMIAVPFMPRNSPWDALPRCAMLLGVNFIYFMRAKTEEWHLSRDPEYVRYALWIEAHGLFRFMRRVPLLGRIGYRRPGERTASV